MLNFPIHKYMENYGKLKDVPNHQPDMNEPQWKILVTPFSVAHALIDIVSRSSYFSNSISWVAFQGGYCSLTNHGTFMGCNGRSGMIMVVMVMLTPGPRLPLSPITSSKLGFPITWCKETAGQKTPTSHLRMLKGLKETDDNLMII